MTIINRKALDFRGFLCFIISRITAFLLFICLTGIPFISFSQIGEEEVEVDSSTFIVVETIPDFPGGHVARNKYLSDNIVYPQIERDNGIQGTVLISFVVEKDGSISNVQLLQGVTPNINEEALRVVREMPNWTPGTQRGGNVRCYVNLPIKFTLTYPTPKKSKKKK